MFRSLSGFKSQYHDLTLVVAQEFDEWKVTAHGPDVCIHGTRQFAADKAKEHALHLAQAYYQDRKHDAAPLAAVEWADAGPDDWLIWRG